MRNNEVPDAMQMVGFRPDTDASEAL